MSAPHDLSHHSSGPSSRISEGHLRSGCSEESGTHCPVVAAVSVIGTEWRLMLIHRLLEGPQRFSEMLRSNPRLNAKTLSATLKFLQGAGVVQRTVVSTQPFVVVYSLTDMGLGLGPAARELRDWGLKYLRPKSPPPTNRSLAPSHHIEPAIASPALSHGGPRRLTLPPAPTRPESPVAPPRRTVS